MNTRRFQYGSGADAEFEELVQGMSLNSLREMAEIMRQHMQYGEALSRGECPIPPCDEIAAALADMDAEELLDWCNNMLCIILSVEQRMAGQSGRAGKQPKEKKARKGAVPSEIQQTCVKAISDLLKLTEGNPVGRDACLTLTLNIKRLLAAPICFGQN